MIKYLARMACLTLLLMTAIQISHAAPRSVQDEAQTITANAVDHDWTAIAEAVSDQPTTADAPCDQGALAQNLNATQHWNRGQNSLEVGAVRIKPDANANVNYSRQNSPMNLGNYNNKTQQLQQNYDEGATVEGVNKICDILVSSVNYSSLNMNANLALVNFRLAAA